MRVENYLFQGFLVSSFRGLVLVGPPRVLRRRATKSGADGLVIAPATQFGRAGFKLPARAFVLDFVPGLDQLSSKFFERRLVRA